MSDHFTLEIHRYALPLRDTLQIGAKRLQQREGLILILRDCDGAQGIGEIAPLPGLHQEDLDAVHSMLEQQKPILLALLPVVMPLLVPRCWVPPASRQVIATPIHALSALYHSLEHLSLPPSVRFGLDMMLWTYRAHLCFRAKRDNASSPTEDATHSIEDTAHPSEDTAHSIEQTTAHPSEDTAHSADRASTRSTVSVRRSRDLYTPIHSTLPLQSLFVGSSEALQKQAVNALETGVRSIKVKVGRVDLNEDIERVRALRDRIGEQARLRIDPNRAWTLDQARRFLDAVQPCPIEYLEEPLQDPHALPKLVQETGVSVALDESLVQLHPKSDDPRLACAKALVLKPSVLGGVLPVDDWLRWSQRHQRTAVFSSSFEAGLGLSFLALWAAAVLPKCAAGLDTRRAFAADLLPPWPQGAHLDLLFVAKHLASFDPASIAHCVAGGWNEPKKQRIG